VRERKREKEREREIKREREREREREGQQQRERDEERERERGDQEGSMENAKRHIPRRRRDLTIACLRIVPDLWGFSFPFQGYGPEIQSMSWPWACFFGRKYFWVGHQMGGGTGLRRESQLARKAPPSIWYPTQKHFLPKNQTGTAFIDCSSGPQL
jgi:hypothetical protein